MTDTECQVFFGVSKTSLELSVFARDFKKRKRGSSVVCKFKCLEDTSVRVTKVDTIYTWIHLIATNYAVMIITDQHQVVKRNIKYLSLFPEIFRSATGCKLDLFGL
jgi:hypothetical protein